MPETSSEYPPPMRNDPVAGLKLQERMMPKALHRLSAASDMLGVDGIGCIAVIEIPEKLNAPVEVSIYSGRLKRFGFD